MLEKAIYKENTNKTTASFEKCGYAGTSIIQSSIKKLELKQSVTFIN